MKIRAANPADVKAVNAVLALNRKQRVEPLVEDALAQGTVGALLRRPWQERMHELLSAQVDHGDMLTVFPQLSSLFVAEDDGEVVGAAQMLVPAQQLAAMAGRGLALDDLVRVASGVTKLAGIAVAAPYRRRGVGVALLQRCVKTYFSARFALIFGQFHQELELTRFYTRCGFQVVDRETGVTLPPPLDWWTITPVVGDMLIARWHPDMT